MVMEIVVSVILLVAGITVLVIIHVCIVGRAFSRGGFDISNTTNFVIQRSTTRRPNMSLDDIGKLPSFDYKLEEERGKTSHIDCAVCLENFKVGEMCRLLPNCNHSFHVRCIDSWLLTVAVCPICRADASFLQIGEQSRNSGEVGVGVELV